MRPINVFIGYDPRESISYHVAVQSIMDNTKHNNIKITPLNLRTLADAGIYLRTRDSKQSTDFSYTRFLVPYLSGYSGRSIFVDCDILFRADIEELWYMTSPFMADLTRSVFVVKHDYVPKTKQKLLGYKQTTYKKKNWSSLMVFNNGYFDNQKLTPDYINKATGMELHQFKWTDKDRIGEIPKEWNWLVGEYEYNPDAKMVHFTIGGPWFDQYKDCDYAEEWRACRDRATAVTRSPI